MALFFNFRIFLAEKEYFKNEMKIKFQSGLSKP